MAHSPAGRDPLRKRSRSFDNLNALESVDAAILREAAAATGAADASQLGHGRVTHSAIPRRNAAPHQGGKQRSNTPPPLRGRSGSVPTNAKPGSMPRGKGMAPPAPQHSPHWAQGGVRQPYTPTMSSGMYNKLKYYRQLEGGAGGRSGAPSGGGGRGGQGGASPAASPVSGSMSPGLRSSLLSVPPPHVLPSSVYMVSGMGGGSRGGGAGGGGAGGGAGVRSPGGTRRRPRQSSISTIASIWNTMIGSTLVTLPYGFSQAGMVDGVLVILVMGGICCYTCCLVIWHGSKFPDFTDFTKHFFGQRGAVASMFASVLVLTGALIAYHILMAQNLKLVVQEIGAQAAPGSAFASAWADETTGNTYASVVVLLLFPLTTLMDAAPLVKLNSCGVIFCIAVIVFIVYHGVGVLALPDSDPGSVAQRSLAVTSGPSFGVLGGIASLSFFIHNAIHPILRNAVPEHRARDTCVAFALVGTCYLVVGLLGYVGFGASPITQNFLFSFPANDWFAFTTRFAMTCQLASCYPLVLFIVRTQFFGILYKTMWPGLGRVCGLNAVIMTLSTCCSIFKVPLATILGYTGAFCSFILVYLVPIGAHMRVRKLETQREHQRKVHEFKWQRLLARQNRENNKAQHRESTRTKRDLRAQNNGSTAPAERFVAPRITAEYDSAPVDARMAEPLLSGSDRAADRSVASSRNSSSASFADHTHVELCVEEPEPAFGGSGWSSAGIGSAIFHTLVLAVGLSTIILQFVSV